MRQKKNTSTCLKTTTLFKLSVLFRLATMSVQFIFVLLASALAVSYAIIVDCNFYTNDYGFGAGPIYTCGATINTLDNNEAITAVTDTTGSADPALQTSDTKVFIISYTVQVEQLPSNFAIIFPNLMGIYIYGTKLRRILPSDLESFPDLTYLALGQNMIKKLDANLFHNNPKLQYIDFQGNSIQEIGTGLLNGLNVLTTFNINSNICTGQGSQLGYINPPDNTLAEFSRDLEFICGPSASSTEPSGPCDPCFANCTARAAALQIRVDGVTESVYAPWFYKLRAFFKAVSMW